MIHSSGNRLVQFSLHHPKAVLWLTLVLVLVTGAMIPMIKVDTDPENMLPADQPDRVLHNTIKQRFDLSDMIVVGVVNTGEYGIYNPATLANIHRLANEVEKIDGVVSKDLMALSHVDNITQEGPGTIRFHWMMQTPPDTLEAAQAIRQAVERLPLLQNTLVSEDNRAAGIYIPITSKHESHRIATEVQAIIDTLDKNGDEFHITGLPVAEDTFGVEMFKQMAVSAPLAGLIIFLMLWFFFRSLVLISAPMVMAVAVVITTMGLLIGLGYTVHIMSSMIPIFLMPIAVVDSVHLLSEFADRYQQGTDKKALMAEIMDHLFTPMLFTTITSSIGFVSLALTPIPPVQVFGIFVATGIALAFLLTITFIPAYVALMSEKQLAALASGQQHEGEQNSPLAKLLRINQRFNIGNSKLIAFTAVVLLAAGYVGITKIQINDNPVRWFEENHPIRIADKVLNEHFAGTYDAFVVLSHRPEKDPMESLLDQVADILMAHKSDYPALTEEWQALLAGIDKSDATGETLANLAFAVENKLFEVDFDQAEAWELIREQVEQVQASAKYFQQPAALQYIAELQQHLLASGYVGKSNSLTDAVKTVYRELRGGSPEYFRIPDSANGVAQTLLSYQSSHRPHDLWHMVTPAYDSTAIWLQLKSGDNQDMVKVIESVEQFVNTHPLPEGVSLDWGGLTYINVIWQKAMVNGMIEALAGSFAMVAILMIVLFRSVTFGLMAMLPLTLTITLIYGLIGFIGKDYDMPIAVLSALSLGLSVDFAIHYIQRTRSLFQETGDWAVTMKEMAEEPGRAITRNAIVIAIGFTPLLLAPLVPYQTVGLFLAAIMAVSCIATIMLLPAIMNLFHKQLFKA